MCLPYIIFLLDSTALNNKVPDAWICNLICRGKTSFTSKPPPFKSLSVGKEWETEEAKLRGTVLLGG